MEIDRIRFTETRDGRLYFNGLLEEVEIARMTLQCRHYEVTEIAYMGLGLYEVYGRAPLPTVPQAAIERLQAVLEDAKRVKRIRTEKRLRRVMR